MGVSYLAQPSSGRVTKILIERDLAVEDVAAGQAVRPLEVERRDHLARDDRRFEAGRVPGDRAGHDRAQPIAFRVPRRSAQVIRRVLHVGRDDVRAAVTSDGSASDGQRHLDPRRVRVAAVLGGVERTLDAVHIDGEPDPAGQRGRLLAVVERRQAGEARQRGHGVVHLRQRAVHADVADLPHEVGRQVHRIDQPEQRPLRVGAGDDGARADLFAACRARRRPPGRRPRGSRRTSAPVRMSAPACRAALASASVTAPMPPRANQPLAIGWPSAAPSRSSSAPLPADHGPRNDPRMPPAATVARSGSLSNHSATRSATAIGIQRSRRYASVFPSARNRRPAFSISMMSPADGSSIDGGGDAVQRAQHAGDAREAVEETRPGRGVLRRERGDLARGALAVRPQHERASVERRRARVGGGPDDLQAVLLEPERADDGRVDGGGVREGGRADAGDDLRRDRRPANASRALDDERAEPALREHRGGHQTIRPRADQDDVVPHRLCPRIRSAAFLPGAPMMPPPGCVADPHIQRFRDRRLVARPAGRRTQEEQLLERQLALEDVPFRQPELALDVERRQHLPVQDDVADVRRVLGDRVDDGVAERLALLVPRGRLQFVRRVLHEAREDVLARRRHRRIGERRNHHVDVRPP